MSYRCRFVLLPMVHEGRYLHPGPGPQFPSCIVDCLVHPDDGIFILSHLLQEPGSVRDLLRIVRTAHPLLPILESYRCCPDQRDHDVVRHRPALHQHPGLFPYYMQYPDKRPARALHDLRHSPFPALPVCLLLEHGHLHDISVQRTFRLRGLHENIILLTFDNHENESFPCHLHLSGKDKGWFLFLFLFFLAAVSATSAVSVGHNVF